MSKGFAKTKEVDTSSCLNVATALNVSDKCYCMIFSSKGISNFITIHTTVFFDKVMNIINAVWQAHNVEIM